MAEVNAVGNLPVSPGSIQPTKNEEESAIVAACNGNLVDWFDSCFYAFRAIQSRAGVVPQI